MSGSHHSDWARGEGKSDGAGVGLISSDDARALWESANATEWQRALGAYPSVIAAQEGRDLEELDRVYRKQLPGRIVARTPPSLELSELVAVVRWKMARGDWRPRNLALAGANDPATVRGVSERAFALAPDPRKPVEAVAGLAGVGPATASAVLAAYRGDLYPFLDDVVGRAIPGLGEPRFTMSYYVRYAEALRRRASELGAPWTAQSVGLALWSAAGGKKGTRPSPRW